MWSNNRLALPPNLCLRNVCAAPSEKVVEKGTLNQFIVCPHPPRPGSSFCSLHENDKSTSAPPEREDIIMTRSRLKQLGLEEEVLKGGDTGCRKVDAIATR